MIPIKNTEIKIGETDLLHLKNFLNDNLQYTIFKDGSGRILHIDSLHEVILKGELRYYGIMGKFKDYTGTHNRQGDFYGEGFKQWEYPGSINIDIEIMNIFLRKHKMSKIIHGLKTKA